MHGLRCTANHARAARRWIGGPHFLSETFLFVLLLLQRSPFEVAADGTLFVEVPVDVHVHKVCEMRLVFCAEAGAGDAVPTAVQALRGQFVRAFIYISARTGNRMRRLDRVIDPIIKVAAVSQRMFFCSGVPACTGERMGRIGKGDGLECMIFRADISVPQTENRML